MTQITFRVAAEATSTYSTSDATTSGPIRIPRWAPDILAISTTTVDGDVALRFGTSSVDDILISPGDGYNRRCFNLKSSRTIGAAKKVTLNYRAVGEMVRT